MQNTWVKTYLLQNGEQTYMQYLWLQQSFALILFMV